jgi:rSAM/selenodomain-associated transferase 2
MAAPTNGGILKRMAPASLSVVIPALNEEELVAAAVGSVREDAEVIVVDGGSTDATRAAAADAGAEVMVTAPGRGLQLDAGARASHGEWLVFLHADTRLEPGWAAALLALPASVVGGAFRFALDARRGAYRWLEAGVALRCRLFRLPYGDQGLFARRAAYEAIGGFRPLALMEDVDFVRRLGRAGPLAFLPVRAWTSARRFERRGAAATSLRNLGLLALYAAGCDADRLLRLYGARETVPGLTARKASGSNNGSP